ncbi:MAG TPA: ATP-binding protein, partial [Polyangiales bacterium]|nr:ATP-binding protein [Polyangiales bacterium]
NLLMVILGNIETGLAEMGAEDALRTRLMEARDAALRSVDLTGGLLAFARKQARAPKVLDINAAISGTISLLQRLIGSRIQIVWRPDPRAWPVRIDASQLDQILTNLVVNARDAIEHNGVIRIATKNVTQPRESAPDETFDWVRISVNDNGSGMDAETLARAFEPFFTTKEEGRGTGLGLATVYGIVTQNGGRVQLHSAPGQGTTFDVDLPRHR